MNKMKRIISLLLCCVLISSTIVLAAELDNSGNNGQGNTGGTNISQGGNIGSGSSHSYGTAWNDFEQGFRVYVVDMNAKLVPGTQVVDYWFKNPSTLKDNTYANGGSKSTCTLRVGQDNSHIPYSRTTTQDLQIIDEYLNEPKVVALGEIGLDYYWDDVPSDKQKEIFQLQVDLAKKHQKPIIIHCRDAYEDTYEVLKRNGHPGIMHCYSGSVEMAKRFIDLGFYISLAGPVTFKNARVPKDVAEKIGLEHLLIETDCPYLTPHPYRGSLNEPANVVYIAQEIAKLKNMEIESVASQTTFNAKKVFGIK